MVGIDLRRVAAVTLLAAGVTQPTSAAPRVGPAQDSVRVPLSTEAVRQLRPQDTALIDAAQQIQVDQAVSDAALAVQDTAPAAAVQGELIAPLNFAQQHVRPRVMVPQERLRLTLRADTAHIPFNYTSQVARTGRPLEVRPVVYVESGGLRYDPGTNDLRGSLSVIVQNPERPVNNEPLSRSVWLQFISDAGPVVPDTLQVGHAGRPPRRVQLRSQTSRDTVYVKVFGDPSAPPAEVPVPVWKPDIDLDIPERPHGFGFEAAVVTVHMPRVFGPEEREVTLHPSMGTVEPPSIRLAGGEDGIVHWRARGTGEATLTASAAGFQIRSDPVSFVWPLSFLIASLLGAILGSVAAQVGATRRYAKAGLGPALGNVFSGLVAGIVTSVAFAIGINLVGLEIQVVYGEAAAFVLAALGAIYGLPGLRRSRPPVRA